MLVVNTIILTNERIRTFLFSVDCVTSEYVNEIEVFFRGIALTEKKSMVLIALLTSH